MIEKDNHHQNSVSLPTQTAPTREEDDICELGQKLLELQERGLHISAHAARLGKIGNPEALHYLAEVLGKNISAYDAQRVVKAMGKIGHSDAIPHLVKVLSEDERFSDDANASFLLRQAVIGALGEIGHPDAIPHLKKVLSEDENDAMRIFAMKALGAIGLPTVIPGLASCLLDDRNPMVRWEAAVALGQIRHQDGILGLGQALCDDSSAGVRQKAAEALGLIGDPDGCPYLVRALCDDKDYDVKFAAAKSLPETEKDWKTRSNLIIQSMEKGALQRADVPDYIVLWGMRLDDEQREANPYLLADYLVRQAVGKDDRMSGVLAKLLVEDVGEDPDKAAERVNVVQTADGIPEGALRKLRVAIGGEKAIGPILRTNLKEYFQQPIGDLHNVTITMWQSTIRYAQWGFIARVAMSIVVFLIGMMLVVTSAYQFLFGNLQSSEMFGTGVSFVSGLGTMLLVIYTGPLKDIKQSVNDLAIASAAFIAYVHRVLEISHTFSYYYLQQSITFDEMTRSSTLIEQAMKSTVSTLNPKDIKSAKAILQEATTDLEASLERG